MIIMSLTQITSMVFVETFDMDINFVNSSSLLVNVDEDKYDQLSQIDTSWSVVMMVRQKELEEDIKGI